MMSDSGINKISITANEYSDRVIKLVGELWLSEDIYHEQAQGSTLI